MKNLLSVVITLATLLLVTTTTLLYSGGWRLNIDSETGTPQAVVKKTGMMAVRSIPESAKVYLDNEAITATDDTIASLLPGKYSLRVEKEGFETWEKDVDVFPELVTDITSILVLQSPRLEPLTNTDVKAFSLSSNQNNIAFLTENHEEPGVWVLPLTGTALNIFRNETRVLIPNTNIFSPSLGEEVWWSPNDKEILIKMNETGYLLYEINPNQSTVTTPPVPVTNVSAVFERWNDEWVEDFLTPKTRTIGNVANAPEDLLDIVLNENTTWSPDEDKFFTVVENPNLPGEKIVRVYNLENPLPIGEKRLYQTLAISDEENRKIYWYSDSYHLIVVEKSPDEINSTISLIRIDGTNRTPVYTGTLASDQAYPSPGGDKLIVITSLKDTSQTNLYAISIR